MVIDVKQFRKDVERRSLNRTGSPIGKTKTGATKVLRALRDEIQALRTDGALWTEIAAALAAQGVTPG